MYSLFILVVFFILLIFICILLCINNQRISTFNGGSNFSDSKPKIFKSNIHEKIWKLFKDIDEKDNKELKKWLQIEGSLLDLYREIEILSLEELKKSEKYNKILQWLAFEFISEINALEEKNQILNDFRTQVKEMLNVKSSLRPSLEAIKTLQELIQFRDDVKKEIGLPLIQYRSNSFIIQELQDRINQLSKIKELEKENQRLKSSSFLPKMFTNDQDIVAQDEISGLRRFLINEQNANEGLKKLNSIYLDTIKIYENVVNSINL